MVPLGCKRGFGVEKHAYVGAVVRILAWAKDIERSLHSFLLYIQQI